MRCRRVASASSRPVRSLHVRLVVRRAQPIPLPSARADHPLVSAISESKLPPTRRIERRSQWSPRAYPSPRVRAQTPRSFRVRAARPRPTTRSPPRPTHTPRPRAALQWARSRCAALPRPTTRSLPPLSRSPPPFCVGQMMPEGVRITRLSNCLPLRGHASAFGTRRELSAPQCRFRTLLPTQPSDLDQFQHTALPPSWLLSLRFP